MSTEYAPVVGEPVQGRAYLIPVRYDTSGEWEETDAYYPAHLYAPTGSEDELYIVLEVSLLFNGLPAWHLVRRDELREMPDTFRNVVGFLMTREEWEASAPETINVMDAIMKAVIKVRGDEANKKAKKSKAK